MPVIALDLEFYDILLKIRESEIITLNTFYFLELSFCEIEPGHRDKKIEVGVWLIIVCVITLP